MACVTLCCCDGAPVDPQHCVRRLTMRLPGLRTERYLRVHVNTGGSFGWSPLLALG